MSMKKNGNFPADGIVHVIGCAAYYSELPSVRS